MKKLSLLAIIFSPAYVYPWEEKDATHIQQQLNTGKTVSCKRCDLSGNKLPRATNKAHANDYQGSDLEGANLRFARGVGINFSSANLTNANLAGEITSNNKKRVIRRGEFDDAQFKKIHAPGLTGSYSTFNGADFSEANLKGANFPNAQLRNAKFSNADISTVDFRSADMTGANLDGANCSHANFSGTNLTGASIKGTKFTNANLKDAIWVDGKTCLNPDCSQRK